MPKTEYPSELSSRRLLRLRDIIGNPKATPPITPLIPVCRSTWLSGVRSGRYPKPIKLGLRVTVWRLCDIEQLISSGGESKS